MTGRYTDGRHAAAHATWHVEDAPAKARDVDRVVREAGWRPRSVVDVGTGAGDVLHALRDRWDALGWTDVAYEGWEPSGDALVRGHDGPRVHRHPGHPTASVRADLVLCLDVAEHVPDDVALLASLAAIADRAVIRLPLDLSALDVLRLRRLLAARHNLGHLHAFSRVTARRRGRMDTDDERARARAASSRHPTAARGSSGAGGDERRLPCPVRRRPRGVQPRARRTTEPKIDSRMVGAS